MSAKNLIEVDVVATRDFNQRGIVPKPASDGGWIVRPVVFDADLVDAGRVPSGVSVLDARGVVVAFANDAGFTTLHPSADALRNAPRLDQGELGSDVLLDGRGRLWYVVRGDERRRFVIPWKKRIDYDRLLVRDAATGRAIAECVVDFGEGGYTLTALPDPDRVVVDAACGQDGSRTSIASWDGERLVLHRFGKDDRCFCSGPRGFSPDGREFVTGSHAGGALKVHAFPSGDAIAEISEAVAFADDAPSDDADGFGYQAFYLDAQHMVVDAARNRLLLVRRSDMSVVASLWPRGDAEPGWNVHGEQTTDRREIVEVDAWFVPPAVGTRLLRVRARKTLQLLDLGGLRSHPQVDRPQS